MKKITYWIVGGLTGFYMWVLFYFGIEYLDKLLNRLKDYYDF